MHLVYLQGRTSIEAREVAATLLEESGCRGTISKDIELQDFISSDAVLPSDVRLEGEASEGTRQGFFRQREGNKRHKQSFARRHSQQRPRFVPGSVVQHLSNNSICSQLVWVDRALTSKNFVWAV